MHQTTITFPQLRLQVRDGHKLRGYFAEKFGQESDLFHNHAQNGKAIYRYPRIQYKVVKGEPMLVGVNEGAEMLIARFLEMKMVNIDGCQLPLDHKNLKSEECITGVRGCLYNYRFVNLWMALNQQNYEAYQKMNDEEKQDKLRRILIGNIIAFFKAVGYQEEQQIMVHLQIEEAHDTHFKDQRMKAFKGSFVSNVLLPDYIGLGKSVARGFGVIQQMI